MISRLISIRVNAEELRRIDAHAVRITHLKMQMRTRRIARIADQRDHIAALDLELRLTKQIILLR